MARDLHADNAKIAIELILTKQPLRLAIAVPRSAFGCCSGRPRCFRREMLSQVVINVDVCTCVLPGYLRECNGSRQE